MLNYLTKVCVVIVLGLSCLQAVSLSASPNAYWVSVYCIILFSLETSCAFLLFARSGGRLQKILGWLFLAHGIYPLSVLFLSGLAAVKSGNSSVILFALCFVGGALFLLASPPVAAAALHGWRDRFLPVLFFSTYLPGSLLVGKMIESDGPANEVSLLFSLILLLMAISVFLKKVIAFIVHLLCVFSVCYIIGYTVVIHGQSGSLNVFLVFPAVFVILYAGLTIRDKRHAEG
ncbi:MAG: hypothetical protein AB7E51_11890 [Pseudodesulfovibrio sp.]|uniref:Histidine kinase n=1 Tax=Pseudodesulfovibrio indicus TaxID=1716143 RepID=A0A126QJI3_9BACT|nr:hypothetical protein [Pseudodesulfovibrio indicus]AMK10153.1 hypothetical protein AWY79_02995 [Pseudodesulfovibrio indicus]TDT87862.1 hypothetical protein EDC59_10757 [Pseudodesulfovibrio indicus]